MSALAHLPPTSLEIFLGVTPFVLMLLSLSVLPMLVPHWWESNVNRAKVAGLLGLPTALMLLRHAPQRAHETLHEYLSFILVLAALYVVSSHIVLRGRLSGRPLVNTALLAVGAVLASLIGTTGASMLLVRPLVRSNAGRQHRAHAVVFFIFVVSNIGGLLTPLGDPPLYLGYLRGVPFFWTLRLWPQWALGTGYLLGVFYLLDRALYNRERQLPAAHDAALGVEGSRNLLSLLALVGVIGAAGTFTLPAWVQPTALVGLTAATWFGSPARVRRVNAFSWAPLVEVAIVFAGIFATMAPALALLEAHGSRWLGLLGLQSARHFFWVTGLLSSALDNAPTYLTASAAASSLCGTSPAHLDQLCQNKAGATLLRAISCGAVMMGANTYLGNGPNFMVKAVAEAEGTPMPSFFGYMGYSAVVLLPFFALLSAWSF